MKEFVRSVAVSIILMAGTELFIIGTAAAWGAPLAVIVAVFALLVFGVLGMKWAGVRGIAAVIVGAVVGIAVASVGASASMQQQLFHRALIAHNVTLADAPLRAERILYFSDGAVARDFAGSFHTEGINATAGVYGQFYQSETYAAPLVPEHWDPAKDLVRVWVVCSDIWEPKHGEVSNVPSCMARWKNNFRAGFSIDATTNADAQEAVSDAQKKFGLISDPAALRIVWSADPVHEVYENARLGWAFVLGGFIVWGVYACSPWSKRAV